MVQINLAAAGNREKGVNLINPRFQAEALRLIRGVDCGVLDNSFYNSVDGKTRTPNAEFMWPITATNVQNIVLGRGMATAYGYDLQNEENRYLTATPASAAVKYVFIYLEWDFSNPVEAIGSIKIHDNNAGPIWTPPSQDNLITNPIGRYQMPLYRLAINVSGAVTSIQGWKSLGVLTIDNVLRANYATHADSSNTASYAQGNSDATINDRIESLLLTKENKEILVWSGKIQTVNNPSTGILATLAGDSTLAPGNKIRILAHTGSYYGEYFGGVLELVEQDTDEGSTSSSGYVSVSHTSATGGLLSVVGIKPIGSSPNKVRIRYHRSGLGVGDSLDVRIYKIP